MPLSLKQKSDLEQVMTVLEGWDFSLTIQKLQEPSYAGWSLERATNAERDYKRYLALTKVFGGYQPVPNGDIDRFWHEHILDTRRYLDDCNGLFGYFLHHYPFFGMRGDQDEANWLAAIRTSNEMWESAFGEPLYGDSNGAQSFVNSGQRSDTYFLDSSASGELDMSVQITITITVGENGKVGIGTRQSASAEAMKCPQACPNPGADPISAVDAMKCPQACPNPGADPISAVDAMKCPQACPNPGALAPNEADDSPG